MPPDQAAPGALAAEPATRLCVASPGARERDGRGVSVAVIDSGVNAGHPHVGRVAGGLRITLAGERAEDHSDRLGHGTAVLAAIQEKAPAADLFAVRVFDDQLRTTVRALVAAIDWAARRRIRLVNLSLGTMREEHSSDLEGALQRLAGAGGVVVAAAADQGRPWWPGCLDDAVGVVSDEKCPRGCVEVRAVAPTPTGSRPQSAPTRTGPGPRSARVVAAAPYPRPIPGVPRERNLNGVSFAVANATGMLARVVQGVDEALTARGCLELLAGRARAESQVDRADPVDSANLADRLGAARPANVADLTEPPDAEASG